MNRRIILPTIMSVLVGMVMMVGGKAVSAVDEVQVTEQEYGIGVIEKIPGETEQNYSFGVIENVPGVVEQVITLEIGSGISATQTIHLVAWDPTIGLAADEPEGAAVAPGGALGRAEVGVRVASGNMGGYQLSYGFAGSEMVCGASAEYSIPSIATEGEIGAHTWGHSLAVDGDDDGVLDEPQSWRPGGTVAETLAVTTVPSTWPFDGYGMVVGVRAGYATVACEYSNSILFTAVGNP